MALAHHHDSFLLHRLLADADVRAPHTGEAYTEAMLAGLGGGIGFMGALFTYEGHPPMVTWVLRYHPQDFIEGALERAGVTTEITRTGSAKVAAKNLGGALDESPTALVVGVRELLPWHHLSPGSGGPFDVRVVSADGETATLDDGTTVPSEVSADQLAAFRAADKKLKHRCIGVTGQHDGHDLAAAITDALDSTVANFVGPVLGNSFDTNFGLSGLERLAERLADTTTKDGWLRVFTGDRAAQFAGLRRVFDCIEIELSATGGMRPTYAQFLREAAPLVPDRDLASAATAFDDTGAQWTQLAHLAVEGGDGTFASYATLAAERQQLLSTDGSAASDRIGELTAEMTTLVNGDPIDDATLTELFGEMSSIVDDIRATEADAIEALRG